MLEKLYHKFKNWISNKDFQTIYLFLLIVAAIYSFMSIHIHNKFMTFGLDLGYFDEAIWKISKFKFPYSGAGCIWLLEDHFQLFLFILAPLYWLWENVAVILIAQSFAMVFAGLPLYLLAKDVTKNKLFSFSIVFAYLFFMGTQFAILNEFHQVTFAPLFICIAYYALKIKRSTLYWFSILMLLLIKEDLSLLVAAIGIGLIFSKKQKSLGIATAFIGISLFFFLTYYFMPLISFKGVYAHFHLGSIGETPKDVIINILKNPKLLITTLTTPLIKIKTLFQSLISFGFIPIFTPLIYLFPLIEDFLVRFIYSGPQYTKWGLVNHHAAVGSMLLSITSIYGANKLLSILSRKKNIKGVYNHLGVLLIIFSVAANIVFHGPINSLLKRQFYEEEEWIKHNREVIAKVPNDAFVSAQNNLLPHLTHRDKIYRFPYGLNADYMVFDLHNGPNKYSPLTYEETKSLVQELLTTKRYSIIHQKGDAMLLKRNYKTDITKSKYYGDTRFCYYSWEEL